MRGVPKRELEDREKMSVACRVVVEADQATRSTDLQEADWANKSTSLSAYLSYVHCASVCQSRPFI